MTAETQTETNVAVKDDQTAVALAKNLESLGIDTADLVLPNLLLMQPTSEYVGDGTNKMGDLVHSMDRTVLTGIDKEGKSEAVSIIPLSQFVNWRVYDDSGSSPKLRRVEPKNADTDKRYEGKFEQMDDDGTPLKVHRTINVYALLTKEVAEGGLPVMIRFKSTGADAGRQVVTQMFKMVTLNQPVYAQTIHLSVKKQKKDTNTWAVLQCAKGVVTTAEERTAADKWVRALSKNKHKVDETEVAESSKPVAAPAVMASAGPDLF